MKNNNNNRQTCDNWRQDFDSNSHFYSINDNNLRQSWVALIVLSKWRIICIEKNVCTSDVMCSHVMVRYIQHKKYVTHRSHTCQKFLPFHQTFWWFGPILLRNKKYLPKDSFLLLTKIFDQIFYEMGFFCFNLITRDL